MWGKALHVNIGKDISIPSILLRDLKDIMIREFIIKSRIDNTYKYISDKPGKR